MTVSQADDLMLLKVKATLRLRKLLQREKRDAKRTSCTLWCGSDGGAI